jgi:hypothetical protein
MIELSKKDKKAARQIIETGLLREFQQSIQDIEEIMLRWQKDKTDSRKTYMDLYKTLTTHDKHISMRYDYMTGSKYVPIIIAQLVDGIIGPDDLQLLNETTQQYIISRAKFLAEE